MMYMLLWIRLKDTANDKFKVQGGKMIRFTVLPTSVFNNVSACVSWLPHLTSTHGRLQPAEVTWYFLEDVAFAAVSPFWLVHHPSEEEHPPIQGEQGAARAHGAVGIGPGSGAAHFIGHQVRVCVHTLRQLAVLKLVNGERALESRNLFFPASDNSWELSWHQHALSKVSFWQTGRDYISLEADAVAKLDQSKVIFRTPCHITGMVTNCFYIQRLLSLFIVGAALAWGGADKKRQKS